jgi:hypothetical protein
MIPIIAAVACLILGMKFDQRITGLIGFLLSAILFPFFPAVIASLVILYRPSGSPLQVTAGWTGIAAVITAGPIILFRMDGVKFCNAAELIRHTDAKWLPEDQERFEGIPHHYQHRMALEMPNCVKVTEKIRPEGTHNQHMPWGTLMFHGLPKTDLKR